MKKLLLALLIMVMAFSIAACKKDETGENNNEQVEEGTSEKGVYVSLIDTGAEMSIEKTTFAPEEDIIISFTPGALNEEDNETAWIGTIPSDIEHGSESENDLHDDEYIYVFDFEDGTLTIPAPKEAGEYDLRLHDTDSEGNEIGYLSFVVE